MSKVRITTVQYAWFAGIYEGEGSTGNQGIRKGIRSKGLFIVIGQKHPWLLYRIRKLFGGNIGKKRKDGCRVWYLGSVHARALLRTIYPLLSPHRKQQIRKVGAFSIRNAR